MTQTHRPGADQDQASRGSGDLSAEVGSGDGQGETSPLAARKGWVRSWARRRTVVTVTAAAVALAGGALAVSHFTAGSSTVGRAADGDTVGYAAGHQPLVPDFTATSLTGTPVKMPSYRGKILVLNFWGSWCAPSVAEAPALEVAYQQYHPQGVDFLGDDVNETPSAGPAFTRRYGITCPGISDPGYAVVQQISRVAPIASQPTTLVIDKTGHVVGMVLGTVSLGDLATLLHQAEAAHARTPDT